MCIVFLYFYDTCAEAEAENRGNKYQHNHGLGYCDILKLQLYFAMITAPLPV